MLGCKGVCLLPSFVPCNAIFTTNLIFAANRYFVLHENPSFLSRKDPSREYSRLALKGGVRKMSKLVLDASNSFDAAPKTDSKLFSAAAARNTQPIIDVLTPLLSACSPGPVISVAEGSGMHVSSFAKLFPQFTFQPTDIDASALESISEYRR